MTPEQFSNWASFVSDGMLLVSRSGEVLACNPAAEALGLPRNRLVGKRLENLASRRMGNLSDFFTECTRVSEPIGTTLMFRLEDGQRREFYCEGLLDRWDSTAKQQRLFLKIKPREKSVVRQFATLNNKIEALNKKFHQQSLPEKDQQQPAAEFAHGDALKDKFLHKLALEIQELRNPIVAELESARDDPASVSRLDTKLKQHVQSLGDLVDDLMIIARINQDDLIVERQPLNVREVVLEARDKVADQASSKGVDLALDLNDEPLLVNGDQQSLIRIVTYLLDNSVGATRPGGKVNVHLTRTANGEVLLELNDSGAGIDRPQLNKLITAFSQGHRYLLAEEGLSLRLSVVHQLVRAHHGRLRVESAGPGKGSTFKVLLPEAS